jgi:hypothetical protein
VQRRGEVVDVLCCMMLCQCSESVGGWACSVGAVAGAKGVWVSRLYVFNILHGAIG